MSRAAAASARPPASPPAKPPARLPTRSARTRIAKRLTFGRKGWGYVPPCLLVCRTSEETTYMVHTLSSAGRAISPWMSTAAPSMCWIELSYDLLHASGRSRPWATTARAGAVRQACPVRPSRLEEAWQELTRTDGPRGCCLRRTDYVDPARRRASMQQQAPGEGAVPPCLPRLQPADANTALPPPVTSAPATA